MTEPTDKFPFPLHGLDGPSRRGLAIDISSTDATLTEVPKALLVGTAGVLKGRQVDDSADINYPVQAGYNPLRMVLFKTSGSTASGIVALFD